VSGCSDLITIMSVMCNIASSKILRVMCNIERDPACDVVTLREILRVMCNIASSKILLLHMQEAFQMGRRVTDCLCGPRTWSYVQSIMVLEKDALHGTHS